MADVIVSLLLMFQYALINHGYPSEYIECPVVNNTSCNGLYVKEDIMLYNRVGQQTIRVGFFVDDRLTINLRPVYWQIQQTNVAFLKSGVNIKIEPAFVQTINISNYYQKDAVRLAYDLSDWENTYPFSDYTNLVHEHQADFVHVMLDSREDWNICGAGWSYTGKITAGLTACYGPSDFATADPERKTSTEYILAHELGHQFGLQHDIENSTNEPFIEGGYGFQVNEKYGTIMSYAETRVPYFSSPKLKVNNEIYGDKTANAVSALNEMAPKLSLNFEENGIAYSLSYFNYNKLLSNTKIIDID